MHARSRIPFMLALVVLIVSSQVHAQPENKEQALKKLSETYALTEKEVVKFVPADAFTGDRNDYVSTCGINKNVGPSKYGLTMRWQDGLHFTSMRSLKFMDVQAVVKEIGLQEYEYDAPDDLKRQVVSGDWIIRSDAKKEDKVSAVIQIVKDVLKRDIKVERKNAELDALVASGKCDANPSVSLSIGAPSTLVPPSKQTGTVAEFLQILANAGRMPLIDRTTSSKDKMEWKIDSSFIPILRSGDVEKLKGALPDVSTQTGLEFSEEKQSVSVWTITE